MELRIPASMMANGSISFTGSRPSAGVNDDGRRFLQELPTQRRKDYAPVNSEEPSTRVSPTDRIRGEIDALFDGPRELSVTLQGRDRHYREVRIATRGTRAHSLPRPGDNSWTTPIGV